MGDIAEEVSERIDDPSSSGLDRFVGLEHLESGSLRIAKWGETTDVTSAMKLFQAGDVLLARRNVYLRRASMADFDGVCSGDAYVLREKRGMIVEGFLPLVLNTDSIWDYAVAHAAGSMSKRVKWKDLAEYKFSLPPKDEQRRIAEVLWAADEYHTSLLGVQERLDATLEAAISQIFSSGVSDPQFPWTLVRLEDICREPITYGIVQPGPQVEDGVPYINVTDMSGGHLSLSGMARTSPAIADRYARSAVDSGDLVIGLRGQLGLVLIVPDALDGANLARGVARIAVNRENSPGFVRWALRSPGVVRQIQLATTGSTFKEITIGALRNLRVPITSPARQQKIESTLSTIVERQKETMESIALVTKLKARAASKLLRIP